MVVVGHGLSCLLIVGNREDILRGDPTHPVDLKSLFGSFHEWPLRDPMTLQPLTPTN